MMEVSVNDRLGKKILVKCMPEDTIGDFKKILAIQMGVPLVNKIVLQKGNAVLKNHITLDDYEIHDSTNLEMYYA